MSVTKNPDYYRLSTTDRVLALAGVPIRYLTRTQDLSKLRMEKVSYQFDSKVVILTPEMQTSFYWGPFSTTDFVGQGGVYALGSFPTEEPAYLLASDFSRKYYNKRLEQAKLPKVKWVDLGHPNWDLLKGEEELPELAVVHGLNSNSDQRRLELARDFIRSLDGTTVLVVINCPNSLEFMVAKLGQSPDAVIQLGKTVHRVVV